MNAAALTLRSLTPNNLAASAWLVSTFRTFRKVPFKFPLGNAGYAQSRIHLSIRQPGVSRRACHCAAADIVPTAVWARTILKSFEQLPCPANGARLDARSREAGKGPSQCKHRGEDADDPNDDPQNSDSQYPELDISVFRAESLVSSDLSILEIELDLFARVRSSPDATMVESSLNFVVGEWGQDGVQFGYLFGR
jgi:hypothetical protein